MYGFGLVRGLRITLRRFFSKKITQLYPEVKPSLPARSHGSFIYYPEKCISCNLCANACPNGVIEVEFHSDEKGKRVLDSYTMSQSYCLFCQICVEVCPTAAILTSPVFESAASYGKKNSVVIWEGSAPDKEISSSGVES